MRALSSIISVGFCLAIVAACSMSRPAGPANSNSSGSNTVENSQPSGVRSEPMDQSNTAFGNSTSADAQPSDLVHTPPKGSAERQAIMDALRDEYNDRSSPVYQAHRGEITFVVNFLKVHNGWAWTYAEPHSSDSRDSFGENSGFLLHLENGKWKSMALPQMVDDPDDPENLDYPGPKDVKKIKQKYPSIPSDIFPRPTG